MPAVHRKQGGLLASLDAKAAAQVAADRQSLSTYSTGIQNYYRRAAILLRQAEQYRNHGQDSARYIMLKRFAVLVIEDLPKHRSYNAADRQAQELKKSLRERHMAELEHLRANIKLRDWVDRLGGGEEAFEPTKSAGTVLISAGNLPEIHWEDSGGPARAPPPPTAGAALGVPQPEGFDLLSGLGLGTAAQQAAPAQEQQRQQRQQAAALGLPGLMVLPDLSTSVRLPTASQATLAKHAILPSVSIGSIVQQRPAEQVRLLPAQQRPLYPELAQLEPPPPPAAADPALAALAGLDLSSSAAQQQQPPQLPQPSPYGELQLGPQEVGVTTVPGPTEPLPPGATCCMPVPAAQQQQQQAAVVPAPPSSGVAEVKKLQQIRDVHVSVALMDEFLRYAVSNTRRGIESCGILAGTLSPDDSVFTITTLIVPKQHGTSDTVEMLNEEEIFEVQDSRALYPLGWIHTHPTQTCFLSSVDVHTHCGFQTMLDEAVAVVMAPKDPSKRIGIFRLTTPGGLKLVQRCPHRGFHAHPPTETGQPIYELCQHVYLNPRASFEVIDLR